MTSISRGNPGDLVVRCGEWDTQTTGEPLDHQVCSSRKESWVLHAYSYDANVESMLNPGPHGEPHREPRWVQPSQPRQHDRSSLCWEQLWARRPYWHHLSACLPGAVLVISFWSSPLSPSWSPGELWAEQGLLCEGLGQGCLWQGGRVSGDLPKVCPPMISQEF